jgi:sirohydrochlorin cobaltochelatase
MKERKAIILFGHGSRDPLWRRPIEAVAARLAEQQPALLVCCAYLELNPPDLPGATAQLVAQGATEVTVVPMFLGAGKHAREDLPVLAQALRRAHPQVRFTLQQAVGEDPRVLDLLAKIALE